MEEENNK